MAADTPALAPLQGRLALVTGGGGFIGRWVAQALAEAGADVHVTVRAPQAGAPPGATTNAVVHAVDLAEPGAAAALIARLRPAVVFNLAGYGVDPAERDETSARLINSDLPPVLVEAMHSSGLRDWPGQQVVHAGSALEYGTATGNLREDGPATPTTLYGRTKLEGTRRLAAAAVRRGVRAVTARLFMVYGTGEHAGRLLPALIAAAAHDRPVELTAGEQRRDFTWAGDAAEGMLLLAVNREPELGSVNVATGRLTTVREFTERAAAVLGIAPGRLRFGALPARKEEMRHDPVTIDRLRALAGWVPATTIEEGVARTAAGAA